MTTSQCGLYDNDDAGKKILRQKHPGILEPSIFSMVLPIPGVFVRKDFLVQRRHRPIDPFGFVEIQISVRFHNGRVAAAAEQEFLDIRGHLRLLRRRETAMVGMAGL